MKDIFGHEWFERLKLARMWKNFTLRDVADRMNKEKAISVQSLIAYEKGAVKPKLDVLEELCTIYCVSSDYIIFGKMDDTPPVVSGGDELLTIFMMMRFDKISCDKDGVITIKDKRLKRNVLRIKGALKAYSPCSIESIKLLLKLIDEIDFQEIDE